MSLWRCEITFSCVDGEKKKKKRKNVLGKKNATEATYRSFVEERRVWRDIIVTVWKHRVTV